MSLEDLFQKKLCICGHSIDEEHLEENTCYALDFNGSIYSSCRCTKATPMKLSFKIERLYESSNSVKRRSHEIVARQTKSIQQPKPFVLFRRKKI